MVERAGRAGGRSRHAEARRAKWQARIWEGRPGIRVMEIKLTS